ncbi:kinase-like protein [Backusella circina FSU 941]|nr:kinase-like protein [Backusella circina FSU 941]
MEELESRIEQVKSKIEQNTQLKQKAIQLRQVLKDRNAQLQCETQIKESQRFLEYFIEELSGLRIKQGRLLHRESHLVAPDPTAFESLTDMMEIEDFKRKYTNLELLEANVPISKDKVALKIHQLNYKIVVETKVQQGIRNLQKLVKNNGSDRRRKIELQEKQGESMEKLALLTTALKKYKGLYIGEENDPVDTARLLRGVPSGFTQVTGKLQLKIVEAVELAHGPTRLFSRSQTAIMIKIGGNVQYRTRLSKHDKWLDVFEMHVDKATEVELVVYDQSGDHTLPIGLLWLKIADITENQRKQKLEQSDWVSAKVAKNNNDANNKTETNTNQQQQQQKNNTDNNAIGAWFDVEPVGKLFLEVDFVRESMNRPMNKLGRAGAVRERKGNTHEVNGHQFISKRIYHILKCALCNEFMTKKIYQCEDCGLACHISCHTRVAIRCVSKVFHGPNTDELRHRIPHRFESVTTIVANWCCHCGFMLPLGFKGAQKCMECHILCHTKCASLVSHFCGMSMQTANLMLTEMKAANDRRKSFHPDSLLQLTNTPVVSDFPLSTPFRQSMAEFPSHSLAASQFRPMSVSLESSSFHTGLMVQHPLSEARHRMSSIMTTPVQLKGKVGLDDFNLLAVLGKGNFGKVLLAEEKYTNELYAIKVLKKRFVLDNQELESTRSEKEVFLAANIGRHPFLSNLHSTFQTETRIYFVMEYVSGGDLMLHIQREHFSAIRSRFYACEVLLALEHLHKNGIIYRDLKLDNVMICSDGHIKLVDYGLCKTHMWENSMTTTFCGTPEFMAPEILLENRYGREIDWWAFGVFIYEMLLGQAPFKGEDEDEIFDAILDGQILYPMDMPKDSISICDALLERDPRYRLGSGRGGSQEIKDHPFFNGVDWDDVLDKQIIPPFIPYLNSRADTSNFDEDFTREIPILTPVNAILSRNEQQAFSNFSYVADWAIHGNT